MTQSVLHIIEAIRLLPLCDKIDILMLITQDIQRNNQLSESNTSFWAQRSLNQLIAERPTPVVFDISQLAAQFWPEDDSVDALNSVITPQDSDSSPAPHALP